MNYRIIGYVLGLLMVFEGIFMAVPMITAAVYREHEIWIFAVIALLCVLIGLIASKLFKPQKKTMFAREGYLIVAFSWILLSVVGALPLYLTGAIPSFLDALFESVSGFTTTGATILTEVESLPKSILMWRSFMHWVGGMGVLVFIMAFVPLSGGQNMYIMKAESPGPSVSKLVPRVKTTALILYTMYFALTFAEFLFLVLGEMNIFEALNTAFGTAGTGGFGIRNDGMAGFSPYTQIVVIVFMFLFGVNFTSFYLILRGKFKDAFNTELRVYLGTAAVCSLYIAWNIRNLFDGFGEALRHSTFTVGSIMSTTGFATSDFNLWPGESRTLIAILLFVGACAGSTCGGIKLSRLMILGKSLTNELRLLIHPKQVRKITVDGRQIENDVVRNTHVYMVCYSLIFVCSMLLLSFDKHDLITHFTAVATAINNVGPGLEAVGPMSNFSVLSPLSKSVLIFDMLAGRLEIFPIVLLLTPSTWKK